VKSSADCNLPADKMGSRSRSRETSNGWYRVAEVVRLLTDGIARLSVITLRV
jgi:hypothetical protein